MAAKVRCPTCGEYNPEELELCQSCGANLRPPTGQLEGPRTEPIQPGESPTKKSTAELEPVLPKWLRDVRAQARQAAEEEEQSAAAAQPPTQDEAPDFLAGLESQAGEEEEALPEWLANLHAGATQPAVEKTRPEKTEPPPADLPAAQPPPAEPPAMEPSSAELPEWLAKLQAEGAAQGLESGRDELSEWLASASVEEVAPRKPGAAGDETRPDWLSGLAADETILSAPTEQDETPIEADLPDWLRSAAGELPAQQPPAAQGESPAGPSGEGGEPPPEPPAAAAELPDWLRDLEKAAAPGEAPAAQTAAAGLSDWLASLDAGTEGPPQAEEAPAKGPPQPEEAGQPEGPPAEEPLPDWLASLPEAEQQPAAAQETPPAEAEGAAEEAQPPASTPAFIQEETAREDLDSIFSMEMPEWLSALGPAEAKPSEGGAPLTEGEALAPAELPSWVQAMRPVEAVVPETPVGGTPGAIPEREGPLAGLQGVLPAVPGMIPSGKPKAHAIRLQATEGQQAHAALLEQIIAAESTPQPITTPPFVLSQRVLRWAIAALIVLLVSAMLFSGSRALPMPVALPLETRAAFQVIERLPPNAAVLLVFDYEPALAGEMEAAAAPLVDNMLTLRGPRLTLLSTSPTGAALAERFLARTQAGHGYQSGQQYVNLGYLAGGQSGVLGFAVNPPATMPFSLDGQYAWNLPPLQDVRALADFDALVVLTDRVDAGRTWIEQTGQQRGAAPLLIVASAQAGPMLLPYTLSGQVDGMVSGLSGGAGFEQANLGRPGLARAYWDAFSLGTFAAALMIAVGSLWNLFAGRQPRADEA